MGALGTRAPGVVPSALMAVVATLLATGPGEVAAAPTPSPRIAAQLTLSAAGGPPQQTVVASYRYGAACPQGGGVEFAWDSHVVDRQDASSTGQSCTASSDITPPATDSDPGDHSVIGFLVDGSGQPVSRSSAAQRYTVVAADTPPPTPIATPPPPVAPVTPVAVAPAPLAATLAPLPPATPSPSADSGAEGGTFAPYGCRNGVPDTTPCPAVAAAVASPGAPSSAAPVTPPASAGTGVHVPVAALAGGAAGVLLLVVVVTAVGWRSGGRARRARGAGAARGR